MLPLNAEEFADLKSQIVAPKVSWLYSGSRPIFFTMLVNNPQSQCT